MRWASLYLLEQFEPIAAAYGVSSRARSPGQFVEQYRRAGGDWRRLPAAWKHKRDAFVKRHLEQARLRGETLWSPSRGYSRRGLALLMWAYDCA